MKTLLQRIKDGEILISDGAMGTFLHAKGLGAGECPESWCVSHAEVVKGIAQAYIDAGCDIVETNSFGGSSFKLQAYGLGDHTLEFNRAAAALAKAAMGSAGYVAASVGPTGHIVEEEGGDTTDEQLYAVFREQVVALAEGGADAICIETMSSLKEMLQAIRAAKENTTLPVICTFTFESGAKGFRTMMGVRPDRAAREAAAAGADIVGANCGNGIANMIEITRQMHAAVPLVPILIHANAGPPVVVGDKVTFQETPEYMASRVPELIQAGVNIVGGCCGTTPEHIAAIARGSPRSGCEGLSAPHLTSRERVYAALHRRPTDRVPVFMWFHPETAAKLARRLEIGAADVGEAMGNDIRQTWVNNNYAMEGIVHEHDGEWHLDEWGIKWVKQFHFNQIAEYPLAGAAREEVLAYRFPVEQSRKFLSLMQPVLADRREFFIGCDVSPCVFEMYWRLRGMADALLDIASQPDLAREMFRRCADFSIALGERACDEFALDWYWTGDDVAGQQSMMMSAQSWRELIKPELARVFATGASRGLPVAYHCCGALRPIIPDLIEIGMAVLNPVQCNCPGMDPLQLKQEFGQALTFMGGVDTQALLPYGTAEEVRRATARLIQGMTADGGGYILAASHTIPPETPDDNIFAMYAEAGISLAEIFDRAAAIRARSPQEDRIPLCHADL